MWLLMYSQTGPMACEDGFIYVESQFLMVSQVSLGILPTGNTASLSPC